MNTFQKSIIQDMQNFADQFPIGSFRRWLFVSFKHSSEELLNPLNIPMLLNHLSEDFQEFFRIRRW